MLERKILSAKPSIPSKGAVSGGGDGSVSNHLDPKKPNMGTPKMVLCRNPFPTEITKINFHEKFAFRGKMVS